MARYSFSGSTPPKFEHKLRQHKQRFGKIATTVVLGEDENLLLGNLRTTTKFTTTTSVDWEKTGTRTSVSAGKR